MHQESGATYTARDLKVKKYVEKIYMWEEKMTTCEKQALLNSLYQTETLCERLSRSENICRRSVITDTKSGGPGRAVVSADGGVVFSTKAGRK